MTIRIKTTMEELALRFNISVDELAEMWAVPLTERVIITITERAAEKVRTCSQCDQIKPLDEFVGDSRKRGGRGYRCKECRRKQHREYNSRRPARDYQKQWHRDHPDYYREWRQKHPGYYSVYSAAWRVRLTKAPGKITNEEWKDTLYHYGNKCLACGAKENLSMDHIVPLSIGGTNRIDNVQPLCKPCNSTKGAQYIDYRPEAYWADWT